MTRRGRMVLLGSLSAVLMMGVAATIRRPSPLPEIPVVWRAAAMEVPERLSPDDLFDVQIGGKRGYIDRTGTIRIPATFAYAAPFSEGLAVASSNDKYGYINSKGEWVIQPTHSIAGQFSGGLACVRDASGLYGYIRADGTWAITPRFEIANDFDADGRALVGKPTLGGRVLAWLDAATGADATYWWIDATGRRVGTCSNPFERVVEPGGLGGAWEGGRAGFVDHTGAFVIQPVFEEIGWFSEGLAPAREVGGKLGCIDATGTWVIEPKWGWIYGFENGLCRVALDGAGGYIDRQGNIVWQPSK